MMVHSARRIREGAFGVLSMWVMCVGCVGCRRARGGDDLAQRPADLGAEPAASRTGPAIAATPPLLPSSTSGVEAPPVPPTGLYAGASIETACNGVDDDGDGLVDVLLPVGPNACRTSLPGACNAGFSACDGGARVCLGPAPMPEVFDGLDNDCNGKVDDVPPSRVRPRALVVAPRYAWGDAAPDIANVVAALAQAGIPTDAQSPGTDWTSALGTLEHYSLAVLPGYLLGEAMSARARAQLEDFARNGGVVAVFKPVGTPEEPQAWKLTGLRASTRRRDVLDVRFDAERSPAVSDLDSPEERTLRLNERASPDGVEAYFLDPDPSAGTRVVAHASTGSETKPIVTRRPVGKGSVYAFGHDLSTFGVQRCYVNCFEPAGDVLRLVLEGMFRESAAGHVVILHTVPGATSSVLILTHDIDAPDADNDGPWGPPGALQVADREVARGVHATFNITTDYVTKYYNEKTIRAVCDRGMCPLGVHSVTHVGGFEKLPMGTCTETQETYGAPSTLTLCGEVRISRDIVGHLMGRAPKVWRSPYLALPAHLFSVIAKYGFQYDSGFGIGDLPSNLPVDLATVGFHQDRYEHAHLLEFPVALEDGVDEVIAGGHRRVELQEANRARFSTLWDYALLRNIQNRSFTTILVHPSRGRDMSPANLRTKIDVFDAFLGRAASLDVEAHPLEEIGDFWRARLDTAIDASFDSSNGYTGTLTVGNEPIRGLTLEFGDMVRDFACSACGKSAIHGKRVVIGDELRPHTVAAFVARVSPPE